MLEDFITWVFSTPHPLNDGILTVVLLIVAAAIVLYGRIQLSRSATINNIPEVEDKDDSENGA